MDATELQLRRSIAALEMKVAKLGLVVLALVEHTMRGNGQEADVMINMLTNDTNDDGDKK